MAVSGDPTASGALNRLDWQLGEAGRRQHRFSWLTDDFGDWLAVDAYYPSNRVVLIAAADVALIARCEQLVPAHGLYLLVLEPAELAGDGRDVATLARERLTRRGWRPRDAEGAPGPPPRPAVTEPPWPGRAPDREPDGSTLSRSGDRAVAAIRPRHGRRRRHGDPTAGVILVLIAVLEVTVGGGVIGLGAGDYVLGFGLLLDACARMLGTVAASQEGDPDAAWSIVIFGSPALWSRDDLAGDTASLARVTAIIASLLVGLGLALALL